MMSLTGCTAPLHCILRKYAPFKGPYAFALAKLLRRHAESVGLNSHFTIIDPSSEELKEAYNETVGWNPWAPTTVRSAPTTPQLIFAAVSKVIHATDVRGST